MKERYVLGVGYPWLINNESVELCSDRRGDRPKKLRWPKGGPDAGVKYRLVLEVAVERKRRAS